VALGAITMVALLVIPVVLAATSHAFAATYSGRGTGEVSGTSTSGSATLAGHGNLIGPGTLSGTATGVFTSQTCLTFGGTADTKGTAGSVMLTAHGARACAAPADADTVTFSGRGTVTGGKSKFAGARGMLSFKGTYARQSGAVAISFAGRISYSSA